MVALQNTISAFVPSQFPAYIQDSYPNFINFLQTYFRWMEDSDQGNVVYQIRNLLNNALVDTTSDQFLQYFQNDFLPYFPNQTALNTQKLLKVATQFYQTKGSEESLEFLFRVLYNLDSEIYYPKNNILRLSDGKWQQPQSLKFIYMGNFDITQLIGRLGVGSESNTTCVVESVDLYVDPTLNQEVLEIFLSSISGAFDLGEDISFYCGNDDLGNPIIFTEEIIGIVTAINVDPNNEGLLYVGTQYYSNGAIQYNGNPVSIIGGLANSNQSIEAVAYVGNVSRGSIESITVERGGWGYQLDPNTIVTVVDAPGDTGSGANVIVNAVDVPNTVSLMLNTDSIYYKANITLGNTTYQFANNTNANLNSYFNITFSYTTINVAPIKSMFVVAGGSGYRQIPSLNLLSVFDTDYSNALYAIYLANSNPTTYQNYINAKGAVRDIGRIAAVVILNGGSGYSNVTDSIYVDCAYGYNATFGFITSNTGAITNVFITNSGFGYPIPKPPIYVGNSANPANASAGSGASLQAYGDNDGQILDLSVSDIGRIETIRLVNEGFNYVSDPLVSLRNEDITIVPISNNQFYFQTDTVYQGTSLGSATFVAFVDQYDRTNSILRLYNYIGSVNVSEQLIGANFNATPISANTYGNGKAKANAVFFSGINKYPGFWLGTDGFLSADQHLQDNVTYHNYSYQIKVEKQLSDYQTAVQRIVHPAGMKMLGIYTITDNTQQNDSNTPIQTWLSNTANVQGTITVNAFANGIITGFNTLFIGSNVLAGDLIVLSSNNSRLQVKNIITTISNTSLLLESNTEYFAPDRLIITNGSNIVYSTGNTSNLIANDIIFTNLSGNVQTSIVLSANDANGWIKLNTVFSSNSTNVGYLVWPYFDNVQYQIWQP